MSKRMPDYRTLKPSDIDIRDIARSLAKLCRYGGWLDLFYSVAEHCVVVSCICPLELRRAAMLHDAAECWLNDLHGPTKQRDEFAGYRDVESYIMRVVGEAFDVKESEFDAVKHWDSEAGRLERGYIYGHRDAFGTPLQYLEWRDAEKLFLKLFLKRWEEINK